MFLKVVIRLIRKDDGEFIEVVEASPFDKQRCVLCNSIQHTVEGYLGTLKDVRPITVLSNSRLLTPPNWQRVAHSQGAGRCPSTGPI